MRAKRLIDRSFVTLDLGESLEVEGVVLPRFSTWQLNEYGVPVDLIALSKLLPPSKVPLAETKNWTQDEIEKLVRRELKKQEKDQKKEHLNFVKNVLVSLFKTLYTKRSFWSNDLSGDRSS